MPNDTGSSRQRWGPNPPPFHVTETQEFLSQVEQITQTIERWDEIKETILKDLIKEPMRVEYEVEETSLYCLPISTIPRLGIYYTVDEAGRTVNLIEAHVIP